MRGLSFPGEGLRARREELGLSVEDAFRKLRIPAVCIRELEAGSVEALPEYCYASGFLKTYCRYLGLSPRPYLEALQASMGESPGRSRGRTDDGPRWLQNALAWAAISAILVLGWVTYAVVFQPAAERSEGQVQAGTVEMRVPQTPGFPDTSQSK